MQNYQDWWNKTDERLKHGEKMLHELLHLKRSMDALTPETLFRNKRLDLIPAAEEIIGSPIRGCILDIGCGNGYLSAWLALNRGISKAYAMEITTSAVEHLIPRTLKSVGVPEDVVIPVLGSFNDIKSTVSFDFVMSMGTLHHSEDLLHTLGQCWKCLSPGGWLIAQEPAMDDSTPNSFYHKKYESEENFHGLATVKNSERTDHFFRVCEYKTALHFAGFEPAVMDDAGRYAPSFASRRETLPFFMVARKPLNPAPPVHVWKIK